MLNLDDNWKKVDKENEELVINNVRFVKPLGYVPIDIACTFCKILVSTVEDVETMKEAKVCNKCYDLYYYHNKEKWKKGWRPNI